MKKTHRTVEDFLPLSTPMYHILLALGARRMHGYAMMEAVETRSQGRISLLPGTLYNTLAKMLDVGLISEAHGAEYERKGGSRRHYQVTSLGREVAQAETARIQFLLSIAREEGLTGDSAAPDRAS